MAQDILKMKTEVPLAEIYQEVILDHNRSPRNFRKIEDASHYSHGYNPLCGDDYELFLKLDADGKVEDAGFLGSGCAISKASSSILTTLIRGKRVEEVEKIKEDFVSLVTCGSVQKNERSEIKKLKVFEGVKKFPIRVKCATLIWHALSEALNNETTPDTRVQRKIK